MSLFHHPPDCHPVPFVDDDLDIETTALIAKLALEDIEEVINSRKGKGRADTRPTDEEYAYQVQYEHYKHLLAIAEDTKLAKSISDAAVTDAAYLEAFVAAEAAAAEDRRAAEIFSRGEDLPQPSAAQSRMEDPTFVMHPDPPTAGTWAEASHSEREVLVNDLGRAQTPVTAFDAVADITKAFGRASITPAGPSINRNKIVYCTICNDQVRYGNSLLTPCDHHYCRDCIQSLVETFTRDESLFPLRCCQVPIPIDGVIPFLSAALRKMFEEKHIEFSVLSKDRVYCVSPICSRFLGSSEGVTGWGVICPQCATSTCPRCKQASHDGEDCTVNAAVVELRALARREGWQTCPGCHILVELNVGCYHMTCRCRTQFCYLCAIPWKNCQCPHWQENRLIATAQQRVENELGARAMRNTAPAVIAQQVRERAQALRINHDCEQHSWSYRHGGGRCEECHFHLPSYLLICRGCSILACVRCSRNRF